jgi:hypothetical protein
MKKIITTTIISVFLSICHSQNTSSSENLGNITLDSLWNNKLATYKQTETGYFRTSIIKNSADFSELVKKGIRVDGKVQEIPINRGKSIIYSVRSFDDNRPDYKYGFLATNFKGHIGLEIPETYVTGQFSNNIYYLNNDNLVINTTNNETAPLKLPKYDFIFSKLTPFPYIRISKKDYLFSNDFYTRGNSNYVPEYFNSDLFFNLKSNRLFSIPSRNSKYEIDFGNSKSTFLLEDNVYASDDLSQIELEFDRHIRTNRDVYDPKSGQYIKEKIIAPIIAFNDSIYVSYFKTDNIFKLYNLFTNRLDTIQLEDLLTIENQSEQSFELTFTHCEIDVFGKYLYIEYKNNSYDKKRSRLAIFDCANQKIVYIGPAVGIDYTTEVSGWVMTKVGSLNLDNYIQTTREELETEKYGFKWGLVNVKAPSYAPTVDRRASVLQRYLINFNSFINNDFVSLLNSKVNKLSPIEDLFNKEIVKQRKQKVQDSLINVSYRWSSGNQDISSQRFDMQVLEEDTLSYERLSKTLNFNPISYSGDFKRYELRLLDLKEEEVRNEGKCFVFTLSIDSLPSSLTTLNLQFPGIVYDKEYDVNSTLYVSGNNWGFFSRKYDPITKINDSLVRYNFQVCIRNGENARKFNTMLNNPESITAELTIDEYDENSICNTLEWHLIESCFDSSYLDKNHYWMEIIQESKKQGVRPVRTKLEIQVNDSEEWKFPILFNTLTNLLFTPKY